MKRTPASTIFLGVIAVAMLRSASAVTIDWTTIGNAGNSADTAVMQFDGTTGYGAVGYAYRIGTYEVTNAQYAEFLNAKDPNGFNTLLLYNNAMADSTVGGIDFNNGNVAGSKYVVARGRQDMPVDVTWFEAIRFSNWLNNGQGNGNTETGAYTLFGGTAIPSNELAIARNPGASIALASENEWYKAAYYDPRNAAQGGPPANSHYWTYPTGSNTPPTATTPPGSPNSANYGGALGGNSGGLTPAGAYLSSPSPYGTFDQAGNLSEWNESHGAFDQNVNRGLRGGSFGDTAISSTNRLRADPAFAHGTFRVVDLTIVPEPSVILLEAFAFATLFVISWRRRTH